MNYTCKHCATTYDTTVFWQCPSPDCVERRSLPPKIDANPVASPVSVVQIATQHEHAVYVISLDDETWITVSMDKNGVSGTAYNYGHDIEAQQ